MTDENRIPAKVYKGRAIADSADYGFSAKGNEEISIAVQVPDLGRLLTVFLSCSEKASPYAIEKLRACGWQGDDITNLIGLDANEVDVVVKYETYEGTERMKVDILSGGRAKLANPMDERQRRAFAARMKPLLKGGSLATQPSAPAAARTNRNVGVYDPGPPIDDIPF